MLTNQIAKGSMAADHKFPGLEDDPARYNWGWNSSVSFDFAPCAVYVKLADNGGYFVDVCYYAGAKNGRIVRYWTHDKHTTFLGLILSATGREKLWPAYKLGKTAS